MADTNHSRRADFFDDDPFAELTRIMGHDPRAPKEEGPAAPASATEASDDDFGVDLEKELMGELDFAEFDEPVSSDAVEDDVGASAGRRLRRPDQPSPREPPVQALRVQALRVQALPVQALRAQALRAQAQPVQAQPVRAPPVRAQPVQALPVQALPVQAQRA